MSSKAIVLRFRDSAGMNTIQEHRDIIKRSGFVWWGWWKKSHENVYSSELQELASGGKNVTIGLINRQAGEFFIAQCDQILVAAPDSKVTPDPKATPAYYSAQAWPVWFRLTAIRKTSEQNFLDRFRLVPQSDPSLYIYSFQNSGYEVVPDPHGVQSDEIEVPGNSVLHLSDLHFGSDHAFPVKKTKGLVNQRSLADVIVERYKKSGVGLIVLSGDFITAGDQDGYNVAYEFIDLLLKGLALTAGSLMLVPGNHDIPLDAAEPDLRAYEQETPFRRFAQTFHSGSDLEFFRKYRTPSRHLLFFVGFNSSRLRSAEIKEYGYVGEDRYGPLLGKLKEESAGRDPRQAYRANQLNFAVLHHHLLPSNLVTRPESRKPVSLTIDAGQIIQDLHRHGVHFALHGHQHTPFIASTSRYGSGSPEVFARPKTPLYVIGAGSAGCKVDRLWEEMRNNTSSLYTPEGRGLRVEIDEFNPGKKMVTRFSEVLRLL